jgi:asparagine synthase (glutamine-hydrolysing)
MDGEDGDACVGGSWLFMPDLAITGRWRRWYREASLRRSRGGAGWKAQGREAFYLNLPPRLRWWLHRRQGVTLAPDILSRTLVDRLDLEDRMERFVGNQLWAPGRLFRQGQAQMGGSDYVGMVMTGAADRWRPRGIALSHPFGDRRVMSFCMGLPYTAVKPEGRTKAVLREAMVGRLPEAVRERHGKADISEVLRRAVGGRHRTLVLAGLELATGLDHWFDATQVDTVREDFEGGRSEALATRVAMLAFWLTRGAT